MEEFSVIYNDFEYKVSETGCTFAIKKTDT